MRLVTAFAVAAVFAWVSPLGAQPADVQYAEEPTGGINLPGNGISGEYDATAVTVNPAGLGFLTGPFLGVSLDLADDEGFRASCVQGLELGFDGKTLIHPAQIEGANAAFGPKADEIARAKAIIAAFDLPENASKGAIQIDGEMVERLHIQGARDVLARAQAFNLD